jgi:hypothetical protein
MAVNKAAGETKVKEVSAQKTAAPMKKAAPKKAAAANVAAPKKAAAIKKPASVKLTVPQHELLKKLAAHTDPAGYYTDKKPELKVLESLLKHKMVKTIGKKNPTTKLFNHMISIAGKKHLASGATPKS